MGKPRDVKTSLGIAIPTFQRPSEFKRLLSSLSDDLMLSPASLQENVRITIYENPSQYSSEKRDCFESIPLGSAQRSWNCNDEDIGGDANIEQAYMSGNDLGFVWVIGDDETVLPGSLSQIFSELDDSPHCGLFLLRDATYQLHPCLIQQNEWKSYLHFAQSAATCQPNVLVAHTLISANIVKAGLFNQAASLSERYRYSRRAGLPFCFSHMHGILAGLSQDDELGVKFINSPVLDTSRRAAADLPKDLDHQLDEIACKRRLYRHYIYWLGHEFGLDVIDFPHYPSMDWCFDNHLSGRKMLDLLLVKLMTKARSALFMH